MSKDTLELLRECDSGIKMAVGSIDEVSGHIKRRGSQKPARKEQGGTQSARRDDKRTAGIARRRRQRPGDNGKEHVVDKNQRQARHERLGQDGRRSDDRRVRHGHKEPDPIPQRIQRRGRRFAQHGAPPNRDRRGSSLRTQTVSVIYLFAGRRHYYKSCPPRRSDEAAAMGCFSSVKY